MLQPPLALLLESAQSDPRPQMTQSEIERMFRVAQIHGGSFERAMAAAGLAADPDNTGKILRTWPELQCKFGPGTKHYEKEQERAR